MDVYKLDFPPHAFNFKPSAHNWTEGGLQIWPTLCSNIYGYDEFHVFSRISHFPNETRSDKWTAPLRYLRYSHSRLYQHNMYCSVRIRRTRIVRFNLTIVVWSFFIYLLLLRTHDGKLEPFHDHDSFLRLESPFVV